MTKKEKLLSETLSKFKQYYHFQVKLDSYGVIAAHNEYERQVQALWNIDPSSVNAVTFTIKGKAIRITDEILCSFIATHAGLIPPSKPMKHKTTHAPYVIACIKDLSKLIDESLWKKAGIISKLISEITEPHKNYSQTYVRNVLKSLEPL